MRDIGPIPTLSARKGSSMRLQPSDPFFALAQSADDQIDLARGALLIAQDAYPDLDAEIYLEQLDQMAAEIHQRCGDACTPIDNLDLLNHYLFVEHGFQGNANDYYDLRNSYLNQVLERKLGIPITLSIVYLEVGRRLGLPLFGVNFPGHFLVKYQVVPEPIFVDPFAGGKLLAASDLEGLLTRVQGEETQMDPAFVQEVTARDILARILRNLQQIHLRQQHIKEAVRMAEKITWLLPDEPHAYRDLGYLYYRIRAYHRSLDAFESYLRWSDAPSDAEEIGNNIKVISAELGMLN